MGRTSVKDRSKILSARRPSEPRPVGRLKPPGVRRWDSFIYDSTGLVETEFGGRAGVGSEQRAAGGIENRMKGRMGEGCEFRR